MNILYSVQGGNKIWQIVEIISTDQKIQKTHLTAFFIHCLCFMPIPFYVLGFVTNVKDT